MHGWAFGALNTGGPRSFYLDNVTLYGIAKPPELAVSFAAGNFNITEGTTGDVVVRLNRPMTDDDPAQVCGGLCHRAGHGPSPAATTRPTSGTLTFVKDGPSRAELCAGDLRRQQGAGQQRVVLRLSNFISVTTLMGQASAIIVDDDPVDP